MLVHLKTLVDEAVNQPYAVPAFNVFGYEDTQAVIQAAEQLGAPVILAVNVVALKHMPLNYLAPILLQAAMEASVPVCVHLDHGQSYDSIKIAIDHGFTSVMFDGSQLAMKDNIRQTAAIVRLARTYGVSVEAEIGSVGYSDPSIPMKHEFSNPDDVQLFVNETGIDAVAVSVGTLHRMEVQGAQIQFDLLHEIQKKVNIPLVIHGCTGVPDNELPRLVTYRVGKVNIGTALRMAFGHSLRQEIIDNPDMFDRIQLFQKPMEAVKATAIQKFQHLGLGG